MRLLNILRQRQGQSRRSSTRPEHFRDTLLRVNTRMTSGQREVWFRMGALILGLISLVSLLILGWLGARMIGRFIFSQNDIFRLVSIRVNAGGPVLGNQHIVQYAGLDRCANIFSFDIRAKYGELLSQVPRIKSVVILRRLPGELVVRVRERIPVARIEMKGYYLAMDNEGSVLGKASGLSQIPVITGHGMAGLKPGGRLEGPAVHSALELLEACATSDVGPMIRLAGIDVGNSDALIVHLESGEQVSLAWEGMGETTAVSRDRLEKKLLRLVEALKASAGRGKRIAAMDLTLDNNIPAREY